MVYLYNLKSVATKDFEEQVGSQITILKVIREELPEDGFFVDEITQVGFVSWYAFPVYAPRHFISSGYQGNLGYGYATALGVQVANPNKIVVVIAGDGGFMYNVQQLATAVKYKLNVVVIVFNNNTYGNVKRDQENIFEGRVIGSELGNPDFVALAESFGAAGFRAETLNQLRTALRRAFLLTRPAVIEMPINGLPNPWEFIRLSRARPAQ